ncbi:hypothetical protein PHISCL_10960, partial [Aspergillus sclerotialis]
MIREGAAVRWTMLLTATARPSASNAPTITQCLASEPASRQGEILESSDRHEMLPKGQSELQVASIILIFRAARVSR